MHIRLFGLQIVVWYCLSFRAASMDFYLLSPLFVYLRYNFFEYQTSPVFRWLL